MNINLMAFTLKCRLQAVLVMSHTVVDRRDIMFPNCPSVRLSVRLSVRPSVRLSVRPSRRHALGMPKMLTVSHRKACHTPLVMVPAVGMM